MSNTSTRVLMPSLILVDDVKNPPYYNNIEYNTDSFPMTSVSDLSPAERGSFHQLQKRQRPHGDVGDPGAVPDPAARARHGAAGLHAGPRLYAQVGRPHCAWIKEKSNLGNKTFLLTYWQKYTKILVFFKKFLEYKPTKLKFSESSEGQRETVWKRLFLPTCDFKVTTACFLWLVSLGGSLHQTLVTKRPSVLWRGSEEESDPTDGVLVGLSVRRLLVSFGGFFLYEPVSSSFFFSFIHFMSDFTC